VTEVLLVPKPENLSRVESGVVQFGEDDWPGVFIRGDNALAFAMACQIAAEKMGQDQWVIRQQLIGLADTLRSCSVGNTGWPPFGCGDSA
jgi:hypothetical protein